MQLKCPLPILSPKEAWQPKEDKEEFFNFLILRLTPSSSQNNSARRVVHLDEVGQILSPHGPTESDTGDQ